MAEKPRHALAGDNTVRDADARVRDDFERAEQRHGSLEAAVRAMMALGYQPTVRTGDSFGPVAIDDELVTIPVTGSTMWGNHTAFEAERAAAAHTRLGGSALVVLHDRVYNIIEVDTHVTAELAGRLNERALSRRRFQFAHAASDNSTPRIVAIATGGYAFTLAPSATVS